MKQNIYLKLFISLFIIVMIGIKLYGSSDFSYTLDTNGNAKITAYKGLESNLTIPNIVDGHNVVTIGSHAFDESGNSTNGHTIKNIVISEGIEKIELLAFAKCTNLESVKLPESLTFLDMQAFLQCTKLKSINIPSKIKSIANSTFQETAFTEFDIPENVKSIEMRALGICSNLEKVRVYSKDITYEPGVFEYGSQNLTLYGYEGSTTQTYAKQNGIKFESLYNESSNNNRKTSTSTSTNTNTNKANTPTSSITLNKNELYLKENESETLTVNLIEMPSSTELIWSSNDENVAIVENGKITAKTSGSTIITVSDKDGTKKATCNVTVTSNDEPLENNSNNLVEDEITSQSNINIIIPIISVILLITIVLIITIIIVLKKSNY